MPSKEINWSYSSFKFKLVINLYKNSSSRMPLCFIHNKGVSVSKSLPFNEYILKNMGGKQNNYSVMVYGETET